jgi:hypothetical protein
MEMPVVINPADKFYGRKIIIEDETEHDVMAWVDGSYDRKYLFAKKDIDIYQEGGK